MSFSPGHIQAGICSLSIVIWVPECLQMLLMHLGPYYVLINFVNFGRKTKSLTSSGRKFKVLGPSVLKLFSLNVVVFALLKIMS